MRSIVWFRHNLRLSDNAPLRLAAEQGAVLPVYVHDPALSLFSDTARRVWRSKSLESLDSSLRSRKNRLFVFQGSTQEILRRMAAHIRAQKIYAYRGLTSEDRALEDILSGSLAEMGVQLCLTGFDTLFPPGPCLGRSLLPLENLHSLLSILPIGLPAGSSPSSSGQGRSLPRFWGLARGNGL